MVPAAVTAISAAVGGYASYAQARAVNKAAEANARATQIEMEQTKAAGDEAEAKQMMATKQLVGQQKAAYAAGGVDVNSGTPIDIQAQTMQLGVADSLTIRSNTQKKIAALDQQRRAYLASKTNPFLAAGKTIMTDLAMGSVFKGMKMPGASQNPFWQGSASFANVG